METALEHILIDANKQEMILYIQTHPSEFEELIGLATSHKQPYSWRAAWLLYGVMETNDSRISKHLDYIIKNLDTFKDGQQRNLINVLLKMEIKEKLQGLLFDICVNIWTKIEKQPSVRYKAFELILQITKRHPELYNEVVALTQEQYVEPLSHGIKSSMYKKIKSLNKSKKLYF